MPTIPRIGTDFYLRHSFIDALNNVGSSIEYPLSKTQFRAKKRKINRPTVEQKRKELLFTRHVTSGNVRVWNRDVCIKS